MESSNSSVESLDKAEDNAPSAMEIIGTLMRTMHAIRRGQPVRISERDLSGPRSRVLAAVAEARPVRMGDLAGKLGLTARTITTFVDALEQDGLIERKADPTDRRATLIDVTPIGLRYAGQASQGLSEFAEQVVGPLSAEERRLLLDLLVRLQLPGGVVDCDPGTGDYC
jgi:DNA-binding MarR family transcriptional regulator